MPWQSHEADTGSMEHPWDEDEVGVCPHCGSKNDPFFEYCKNCVGQLPVAKDA